MGLVFVKLKDWDVRRKASQKVQAIAARAGAYFAGIKDASIFVVVPPAVTELGNATGFDLQLQDRAGVGHEALLAARNQLLGMAAKEPALAAVRPNGVEDAPQFKLNIDGEKADGPGSVARRRSTARWPLPGVRPTSTTSSTAAASSASTCRARPQRACSRMTWRAGTCAMRRAGWCRSPRSQPAHGASARRSWCATTACRPTTSRARPRRGTAPARRCGSWRS